MELANFRFIFSKSVLAEPYVLKSIFSYKYEFKSSNYQTTLDFLDLYHTPATVNHILFTCHRIRMPHCMDKANLNKIKFFLNSTTTASN